MSIDWMWLCIGLVIGTTMGFVLLGLCLAAKQGDE